MPEAAAERAAPPGADLPGVDLAAVTRWICSVGVGAAPPLRVTRVGLGQSNLTYLVRDRRARAWVLRRPPVGHLLQSAHDVVREARVLSALEGTDVPVPRVLGVARPGEAGDAPVVLMEFVAGLVIDRVAVAAGLSEPLRHAVGLALPRVLARVHAIDLKATGLDDLAGHSSYAARQLKRWSGQWERSKTRELPGLDRLTARLRAAVPQQRELTLVHGDLHLRNVIVSPSDGDVTAVLDWELCTLGDPLADLGTLLAYWPEPGEDALRIFAATTVPGLPGRAQLIERYAAETGRDMAAVGFWHALGLWKMAIIGEGVLRRALDDPRNRAVSGTPDQESIAALVVLADRVATRAGI